MAKIRLTIRDLSKLIDMGISSQKATYQLVRDVFRQPYVPQSFEIVEDQFVEKRKVRNILSEWLSEGHGSFGMFGLARNHLEFVCRSRMVVKRQYALLVHRAFGGLKRSPWLFTTEPSPGSPSSKYSPINRPLIARTWDLTKKLKMYLYSSRKPGGKNNWILCW